MPLPTFNWIDATNYPTGPENAGRQEWLVARHLNFLYVMVFDASSTQGLLYVSSDSGVSWTLLDSSLFADTGSGAGTMMLYDGTDSLLRWASSNRGGTIDYTQFDPANPGSGWTGPFNISGFDGANHVPSVIDSCLQFEYRRNDGTIIVAKQDTSSKIRVLKNSSGTWTSLALIDDTGSGRVNYLFDALQDAAGNVHLFGLTYQNSDICSIWHRSVSTADVVSSAHILEAGLEDQGFGTIPAGTDNPASTASGPIGLSADGKTIAFAYCKNAKSRYSSPSLIELHAAIGDLSSTPLDPSWTIETVATGVNPGCVSSGASVAVGCSFKGTNDLSVYYFDGAGGGPADLKTQDRTAPSTWSSATYAWDHTASPAVNSPVSAGTGLDGFGLLNAFTNGVGILVGLFSGSHVYTGYVGPPIISRKNNYTSSGGPMVGKGTYAAC